MKRIFSRKETSLLFAILLLFIIGQIMGSLAIRYFFLQYKLHELEPQARQMAIDFVKEDNIKHSGNFMIKIFDVYGNEFQNDYDVHIKTYKNIDFAPVVEKYMPQIVASQTISSIEKISGLPSVSVVIGVPVVKEGSVIGALFLMMPADDYKATLNGFSLVFFVTLLIGTGLIGYFLMLYLRQTRELEQTRRDYIANISHELKSPIASIKALTETLLDDMVQEKATKHRYYSIILHESNQLEKHVLDMLELSKLQSKKIDFGKEKTDAQKIFTPIYEKYAVLCEDLGISFNMTDEINRLPLLYTNTDRVIQLLVILLDNAVKFTGEEGQISIDAKIHRNSVTIFVRDNGIGIEKEILPYIFDRFYKEDKAHNTKGSGLGLAIAREIISGLNESISVTSTYGRGTTFRFTIKSA